MHAQVQGKGWLGVALLGLHYAWVAGACFTALSPDKAVLFFVLSQCLSGFLLSIVFVQSHNGMTIYSTPTEFVTAQVISTRDILSSAWTDWFTGSILCSTSLPMIPSNLTSRMCWKVQLEGKHAGASPSLCCYCSCLHSRRFDVAMQAASTFRWSTTCSQHFPATTCGRFSSE